VKRFSGYHHISVLTLVKIEMAFTRHYLIIGSFALSIIDSILQRNTNSFVHTTSHQISRPSLPCAKWLTLFRKIILPFVLHRCETMLIVLREAHKCGMSEHRVFGRFFGSNIKRQKVAEIT